MELPDPGIAERFELLALAGRGGMGEVYQARERASGSLVALKLLHGEGDRLRFAREAAVLSSLHHPGVVGYLDHGITSGGRPFLVMEWLVGHDLDEQLGRGLMSVGDAVRLGRGAAEALAAAHLRGVVHRDLKPSNIFLCDGRADRVKLVDFGLARLAADEGLTAPGVLMGTPAYMAPEQVRGGSVDSSVDVYALGAVLFRCLTGRAPFSGPHHIAILAKAVLEAPPDVRDLRPDVPPALAVLISRMLAKEPRLRPADGAALVGELSAVGDGASLSERPGRAGAAPAITGREQRVACVVLCSAVGGAEVTVPLRQQDARTSRLREAIEERGGVLDVLGRGTWLVTVQGAASPSNQAARAARCALAIAALRPATPVFVATGRVIVARDLQVGEVIDRATRALVMARELGLARGVRLDEATAALLDDRFELRDVRDGARDGQHDGQKENEGDWRELVGEHDSLTPQRTVLGRTLPCVGRAQELASLGAALEACIDEPRAVPALVTAPPGVGKSRLVGEFLRTKAAGRDIEIISARGDVVRAGSPFGMASQIIRRAGWIIDVQPLAARARSLRAMVERHVAGADAGRLIELLGELCGVPTAQEQASAGLRAARADSALMADALREAWTDWLRALSSRRPVLVVLEDVHWFDLPSVRLIDAALEALADQPLFVLATARPEVRAAFPELWQRRGLQELHLGPLTSRAAHAMVREALGDDVDEATVRSLVERAGGHPFHIEELVRAVASGRGAESLPDSVLGMVQARLDVLGADARRVLRAASVFGETFWSGGVEALMGSDAGALDVPAQLAKLASAELVIRRAVSKVAGETEYVFRHALVRDAAHAMLTEQDSALAHRLAGAWLEEAGESDPAVLAEHHDRGGSPERALGFFRRAAAQALEGNDLDRALLYVARAGACGPGEADRGALGAIEAEALYWRGSLEQAAAKAAEAADGLDTGTVGWLDAVSVAVGALGQRGLNEGVAGWLERAALAPSGDEARGAHVVALCRGMTQLAWAHYRGELGTVRARFDELVAQLDPPEPYHAGWIHRVRAESAWLHDRDVDRCLAHFNASCAAFETARAQRALCLTRLNAASLSGWSGRLDAGLDLVARSEADGLRLGSPFLSCYCLAIKGLLLAYDRAPSAEETMQRALSGVAGSPRLAFVSHLVIGRLALARGDIDAAERSSRAALVLPVAIDLQAAGRALASSTRLARGDLDGALEEARLAVKLKEQSADLELTEGMSGLALAEALDARGARSEAEAALRVAYLRLAHVAEKISSPEHRRRFWARSLPNDRILQLATAWGVAEVA
jgi:eukaryotic-like serine/threonine-protein kinase